LQGGEENLSLNVHWFETVDAEVIFEAWKTDDAESRPHTSLNEMTSAAFARQTAAQGPKLSSKNAKG
jgi:putative transposase